MSAANSSPVALFVSPHFDDIALSCGGIVAAWARAAPVVVATVFAAEPTGPLNSFARFQHDRWRTGDAAVDERRAEDREAMRALGATPRWLEFPDAIYRGDLYRSDDDLFGPVKAADDETARAVAATVCTLSDELAVPDVYLPLGVGGHVDHRVCRDAARPLLDGGFAVAFYEDLPYALNQDAVECAVAELGVPLAPETVDVTAVFDRRLAAIAAYHSQLPTIFRHHGPWEEAIRAYARRLSDRGGYAERVWRVVR